MKIQDIIGLSDENEIDEIETQVVKLEPQWLIDDVITYETWAM